MHAAQFLMQTTSPKLLLNTYNFWIIFHKTIIMAVALMQRIDAISFHFSSLFVLVYWILYYDIGILKMCLACKRKRTISHTHTHKCLHMDQDKFENQDSRILGRKTLGLWIGLLWGNNWMKAPFLVESAIIITLARVRWVYYTVAPAKKSAVTQSEQSTHID